MFFLKILLLSILLVSCTTTLKIMNNTNQNFDIQGHRGCRGLMPENSIPAFLHALDLGVNTLELDLAVTKDKVVVVSHEPWLSHEFCADENGKRISKEKEKDFNIYEMTFEDLKQYDCGSLEHPRFKNQKLLKTYKPSLIETIEAVKKYCKEKNRPMPNFNIEIKWEAAYINRFAPDAKEFVSLVLKIIRDSDISKNCNLQSFDFNVLQICHQLAPEIPIAFLRENPGSLVKDIDILGFQPEIYSCHYSLVNKQLVKNVHELGMKIIPWTVNEKADIIKMIELNVDGIISDYPERVIDIYKKGPVQNTEPE
jgi:glycerophosphoryl diester phosphodiesterase